MAEAGPGDAIRLDMCRAVRLAGAVSFIENGPLRQGLHVTCDDFLIDEVGDVVLARRGMGTSYHLSVVVDDAFQQVSEVVRGVDLLEATPIHRILQMLLEFPQPTYYHHELVRDETGKRLAKRDDARALASYRAAGLGVAEVRALSGFTAAP